MKKLVISFFVFIFLLDIAAAQHLHMNLLAVSRDGADMNGRRADLFLDMQPGTGRIFIDSYPLTQLDTQISTRFANQIACDFSGEDCSKHDFFYTIRASSPIIGGPSAGAALALITLAGLEGFEIPDTFSVTGTINSGELIGPVGGLKQKIEAAAAAGLKNVMVPMGETEYEEDNITLDLFQYGAELGVEVLEVATLDEIYGFITGKRKHDGVVGIVLDPKYEQVMSSLAAMLCDRASSRLGEVRSLGISPPEYFTEVSNVSVDFWKFMQEAEKLNNNSILADSKGSYYSSASFCYGSSLQSSVLLNLYNNMSYDGIVRFQEEVQARIDSISRDLESRPLLTLSDLEAYIIVRDRLVDAQSLLDDSRESLIKNDTRSAVTLATHADERYFSAVSWSHFFGQQGKELEIDVSVLSRTCQDKISEAEERLAYVRFFLPDSLDETSEVIDLAKVDQLNEEYELCLFKASKAKAEADIVLSTIGIGENKTPDLLHLKLDAAERIIADQSAKGNFPILGYSYFEYAQDLEEEDIFSALLYSEYALELSNIDMYLRQSAKPGIRWPRIEMLMIFLLGISVGFLLAAVFSIRKELV
ncbi:hypothetical protein JW968_04860 [Candidatus Woesearchaeota archaeon]|nr:hypothetical protein [Candidatus Woesearchaeota archaeon]